MNVAVYFSIAIVAAFLALYIRQIRPDFALGVTLAGILILFSATVPEIVLLVQDIRNIALIDGVSADYITPVLKIIGISYLAEIASNLCQDAGERTLSNYVETVGKIAVAFIALPIVEDVFSMIIGLLE